MLQRIGNDEEEAGGAHSYTGAQTVHFQFLAEKEEGAAKVKNVKEGGAPGFKLLQIQGEV